MISVDIEKRLNAYHGQQVLKIAQQFPLGSITKIYGPSGAGKTTFLKVIAGLTRPEKGKIIIDGATWLDTDAGISLSPQQRKVGFVFQNYALFPNMTVRKHLEYATEDGAWINRLLAIGKMDVFANQKPDYLSGGQQQRLAILRAMAIKPKLMLMDEPFSALDPEMKSELILNLRSLWQELGTTALIVSHNPQELDGVFQQEIYISSQ
jgi:molybdate transport system ATP-binding protein